ELPAVLEAARALLAEHGIADRCTIVTGSFFESVPAGDAHILKNIIHDWQDTEAIAILTTCRHAVSRGGRLLVVQEALPGGNAPSLGKLLDLEMLVIGGRERTQEEYQRLLEQADYELTAVLPTQSPLHVIEGVAH